MAKKDFVRTTVVIPEVLDENWEAWRNKMGMSKNGFMKKALETFVRRHGLNPDKTPMITITYE